MIGGENSKKLSQSQLDEILELDKCPSNDRKNQFQKSVKVMKKYASEWQAPGYPPEQGLFKDIRMFNHSCIPNAETYFVDPYMRVYAIQDIAKDEEICLDYVDMKIGLPKIDNPPPNLNMVKEILQSRWEFDCNCELCGNPDKEMREEIVKHRISYWQLFQNFALSFKDFTLLDTEDALIDVELSEKLLQQMSKAKQYSVRDKLLYAMNGLSVVMVKNVWSPTERKRKARYFYQISEEALLICEGIDGPITLTKKSFDRYKAIFVKYYK